MCAPIIQEQDDDNDADNDNGKDEIINGRDNHIHNDSN